MYISLILLQCWLAVLAACNTEAFTFKIPNYYNIPACKTHYENARLEQINDTVSKIDDYPIQTVRDYDFKNLIIKIPYNYSTRPSGSLFVKVNNYNGTTYDSNDLINVKLCWPAVTPLSFSLSHRYLRPKDFGIEPSPEDDFLDIYIEVQYEGDFYAVKEIKETSAQFFLIISKLPNRLPIPIELYGFILVSCDVLIILWWMYPYVIAGATKFLS